MRRLVFRSLAALEFACGCALAAFAWQLPGTAGVEVAAGRVEKVGRDAGRQVRVLRDECALLRKRQPELLALSRRLEKQMRLVGDRVRGHSLDDDALRTISGALGEIATGLDGFAATLDAKGIASIGKGLGATASYLDGKVMPAADRAAGALEKTTANLKADAGKLAAFLKETPLELKAARAMADSLGKFEEDLGRVTKLAKVENFQAMRDGFKGLETSLDSGADQVDKMAKYTLPKVSIKGLFGISVEEKPLWPDAKTAAAGIRQAAKGCQAAGKEMEAFNAELPKLRDSIEQSRAVVSTTRQALAKALSQQEQIEPVFKRLPQNLARLADDLPQLTGDLAKVLRETSKLKEVATALRTAEQGVEAAVGRWPELKTSLGKSAELLRATRKQLQMALGNRHEFEEMLHETVSLTTMFAEALPVLLGQLESGLSHQEESLGDLGDSIDRVTEAVPAAARSASAILATARLLLALVALMVGLHAGYLLGGVRPGRAIAG
jgi:hypothetical protein